MYNQFSLGGGRVLNFPRFNIMREWVGVKFPEKNAFEHVYLEFFWKTDRFNLVFA